MWNNKLIQVFEHDKLLIGEQGFDKTHWEALGNYNEVHGGCFFSLMPKGVKFNQYVGVIQVGNLTIEILPKISRVAEKGDKAKWQKVLIDMLRECRWMQVHTHDKAALRFKPNSILEAYLELFVLECEDIVRQGLVKKYRAVVDNCAALKGKLLFAKQIQTNLVHPERFIIRHQVFDRENIFNQLLFKALHLIPIISNSPFLKDRVYSLLLSFPELDDIKVSAATFSSLTYDRKTTSYTAAMEIAAMLLLNYRPDISAGHNHVLAILFDMNDLWEEFIYRQINKGNKHGWIVKPQNIKPFWRLGNTTKTIRPDIVIHDPASQVNIILDTKWKIPDNNIAADTDLKQMFVYNEYWCSSNALLIYPDAAGSEEPTYCKGAFAKKDKTDVIHSCGILKISVLNRENTQLDILIGKRIIDFLKREIVK